MVWIVLDTDYPGPPPKMVPRRHGEELPGLDPKRRNRERDKVDRGAYVIEGHSESDDGL
jgi:hypothetical protein